jgi:CHRD domain
MAHRRIIGTAVLAIVLAVVAVSPASAGRGGGGGGGTRIVTFDIELTGAAEAPGPGDPDGTGVAQVNVFVKGAAGRTICYAIAVDAITLPATAAHIHNAPAGVAGGIVVHLEPPQPFGSGTVGVSAGCVTGLSSSLVRDIVQHPDQYYVNVHTTDFPAGAVRGQLA